MKLSSMLLVRRLVTAAVSAVFGFFTALAGASAEIAQTPLFLTLGVKPNVMLAVDDSGSMDSEILARTNDGALWWNMNDQSFVGRDQDDQLAAGDIPNFNLAGNANATWKKYVYLFPNGTGQLQGRRAYNDSTHDHYAVPPLSDFAYTRSPAFNFSYFNPATEYTPWPDLGSWTFSDSNPAAAATDPTRGNETMNLTTVRENSSANHVFRMMRGMRIPAGTRYRDWNDNNWKTATSDILLTAANTPADGRGVAIAYFPATFYLPAGDSLPDGYGYLPSAIVSNGVTPGGEPMNRYELRPENFVSGAAYQSAIQNFANWFTYYRKRHAATRGAIGQAFEATTNLRVGTFRINNRINPVPIRDLGVTADRNAFFNQVYNEFLGTGGTPNREAVQHMGEQFRRNASNAAIQYACQQNFGVLFTDGYANVWTGAGVGNADGGFGPPFADSASNTMADIAMHYYQTNLRPDLEPGRVPVPAACNASNPPPWLDCQTNPHMNLFAVTMGTPGTIFGVDEAATADPFANPPAWPTSFPNRNPVHVDDLWHATINSRGFLLDVTVPAELGSQFRQILQAIAERTSSASSVATNSTRLSADTFIYQARFSSADWTGQFLAFPIEADGDVGALAWDAASLLPAPPSRNILTYDPAATPGNRGRPFLWSSLTASQQAALNTAPGGANDGLGQARLGYLRGERFNEGGAGLGFRSRSSLLGDIVNSDPLFVGRQDYGFELLPGVEGSTYKSFRQSASYQSRPAMVYVAANDGKLHGFDAVSGNERFAYVPNAVFGQLSALTAADYNQNHQYVLDGSPRALDAWVNGGWKTILLGSMGAGGSGIFALDVSTPDSFGPASALWEFSAAQDNDLGASIPQPTIARLNNGRWAALVANGYGSANGRAALLIIDLETGVLIRKINTGADGNNGLSSPTPIDADGDRITDFVYAGDLKGNMWKFDLSSSNPNNWRVAFGNPANPQPLYTACEADSCTASNRQPITARPEVGINPEGGFLVYFGTGRYFAVGDNTPDGGLHSFYAIRDPNDKGTANPQPVTGGRPALLRQEVISEQVVNFDGSLQTVRVTTDFSIEQADKGWYLDLPATGERQVSTPLLRAGRVIFTTLIPSTDPCSFGGTSWLMELDALSGSRLPYSPFDLNRDFAFNAEDFVTIIIDGEEVAVPVSGLKSQEGIIKTPGVISDGDREFKYASGSTGGIFQVIENIGDQQGRQSWRQIR